MKRLSVPFVDLVIHDADIFDGIMESIKEVLQSGQYILGPPVADLEKAFAELCQTRYAVGVGSGTEALALSLKAIGVGPGDEVITVPNSFLATVGAIISNGAKPVFVDVTDDFTMDSDQLESAVTTHTRAIIPVHLTGRPADMDSILAVADRHDLAVIEDAAQAVCAMYRDRPVGSWGMAGCFSFHPLKNLNAIGDGGIITTNDDALYDYLIKARNHGLRNRDECSFWGINSRLDTIQAAVLLEKMKYIKDWTNSRRVCADYYREHLAENVEVPAEHAYEYCTYQTFVIQTDRRDQLQEYLAECGVETKVHYPIPIHLQEAAKSLGYKGGDFPIAERQAGRILSLPIYPQLSQGQREYVVEKIHDFFNG